MNVGTLDPVSVKSSYQNPTPDGRPVSTSRPFLHRDWIDASALKILSSLQSAGFETYLVGGCVRDLLAGIHPKDFDIATNARPEQIKKLIPYSFIIGRRFKLVLARRGEAQYEIATFRRNRIEEDTEDIPESAGDNFFGTAQEDAQRRDFTINGLFFNPSTQQIIDHCRGQKDLESRTIRMIGEARDRLVEDPIRILRALRLAHKLSFILDSDLREQMKSVSPELQKALLPRKREEYLKILKLEEPHRAFLEMMDLGVLDSSLPTLASWLSSRENQEEFTHWMKQAFAGEQHSWNPAELMGRFLFVLSQSIPELQNKNLEKDSPEFNKFMKDELGVFRLEAQDFFRNLDFMETLTQTEAFRKRGARRKVAFIKQDPFNVALEFAYLKRLISTPTFCFWLDQKKLFND